MVWLSLAFLSLSTASGTDGATEGEPRPPLAEPPSSAPEAERAQFDSLWANRDTPAAAAELKRLEGEFEGAKDYEKLWRVTRWYFWMADGETQKNRKEFFGKNGWTIGQRAQKLDPDRLEAKYWTSACIGAYSEAVGIFAALTEGLESKFRDPLLDCVRADPTYSNGNVNYTGPETALGRYFDRLPWPKHDGAKAKEWLQRAIAAHPENLRARYFLADAVKGDDKGAARQQLQAIADGSETYDPPEARRVKQLAKTLQAELGR